MIGIFKPFFQLLVKKQHFALSRWTILSSLIHLAILKRIKSASNPVYIKLGKYKIYGNSYHLLSFLIKEKFVDEEYYFVSAQDTPLIIDCGANIGISLIYFKCLYPHSIIHCFEPHPEAFRILQQNLMANNFKDVFLHNTALSAVNGTIKLYYSPTDELINSTITVSNEPYSETNVESITLSGFLQNFDRIDLVKIDVEGAEIEIMADLNEAGKLSSLKVKEFIIEYHYNHEKDPLALSEFILSFKKTGYITTSKVLFPGNTASDLIVTARLG